VDCGKTGLLFHWRRLKLEEAESGSAVSPLFPMISPTKMQLIDVDSASAKGQKCGQTGIPHSPFLTEMSVNEALIKIFLLTGSSSSSNWKLTLTRSQEERCLLRAMNNRCVNVKRPLGGGSRRHLMPTMVVRFRFPLRTSFDVIVPPARPCQLLPCFLLLRRSHGRQLKLDCVSRRLLPRNPLGGLLVSHGRRIRARARR